MDIRTITVELLRAGPRHNQLLSRLTRYLGVCGDAQAGVVTLPYEHADFESQLDDLRYEVASGERGRRRLVLERTGRELAEILGQIPGLDGVFSERRDDLTHLRLVLSASELALLPFELSKVPAKAGVSPEGWLALQTQTPVCVTRQVRSVSTEGFDWPTQPRILFVSGPDVPHDAHYQALRRAIKPWLLGEEREPAAGGKGSEEEWLTCRREATLQYIIQACSKKPYSHVHILAHGSEDPEARAGTYGVALGDGVVSGRRLAGALQPVLDGRVHRPAVVTLATCSSAEQPGDVRTPDASVAHELHDSGIPIVVASQFPLSADGSEPFVEIFYSDQLWGEHPLESLFKVRRRLHTEFAQDFHDWASLVVYEALPGNFEDQLESLRYWQTRRAQYCALERIEGRVSKPDARPRAWAPPTRQDYADMVSEVAETVAMLPTDGPFATDCLGLRAASSKRLAEVAFWLAVADETPPRWRDELLDESRGRLEEALSHYETAARVFFSGSDEKVHRQATLHWLLGQVLSLEVILGRPFNLERWGTARYSAQIDRDHPTPRRRGYAEVGLAELEFLRLTDPQLSADERIELAAEVTRRARTIVEMCGLASEQVKHTGRQFRRYVDWWGDPRFGEALGLPTRRAWQEQGGIVPTAREVVKIFGGGKPKRRRAPPAKGKPASKKATGKKATGKKATGKKTTGKKATGKKAPPVKVAAGGKGAIFDIEMLPAENGDCLWVEYGDPRRPARILIDCGAASAAGQLKRKISGIRNAKDRKFELFVLTHIDSDHIGGVVAFFGDLPTGVEFGDVWYNGWRQVDGFLSVKQAEDFSKLLEEQELPWNLAATPKSATVPRPMALTKSGDLPSFRLPGGMRLTVLSPGPRQMTRLAKEWKKALAELEPDRFLKRKAPPPPITDISTFELEPLARKRPPKDRSAPNGSSIALLAEFDGRAAILTGDAHADLLASSIRRLVAQRGAQDGKLRLDALKLSHHGSANALTRELLELIDCPRYLVSTDGTKFYHPDREAIARVVLWGGERPELCFNYRSEFNGLWGERVLKRRYRHRTRYPASGREGLRVKL